MKLGSLTIEWPVFLAPMAGITDLAFRLLMREMGCGVTVSELVSSEAMVRANRRTARLMRIHHMERPTGIQIFGSNAEAVADTARLAVDSGADFIDINVGCPVRKIIKQGAGAALMAEPTKLAALLQATQKAISVPLTMKIRSGMDDRNLNYLEIIKVAESCGVDAVAIHARTQKQGYTGAADWQVIQTAKAQSSIPIIGNGDLRDGQGAMERWREAGCDGIMVGRGVLKNPWLFQEIRLAEQGRPLSGLNRDLSSVLRRHAELLEQFGEEKLALLQFKKFVAWYCTGLAHSSGFRARLFDLTSFPAVLSAALAFVEEHKTA